MLRSLKDLERYIVSATDGDLGTVVNFLLDDQHWTVRYLVVEAGGFLGGRKVLVSPIFFREADWLTRRFHVAMTIEKIRNSPGVDVDLPVSRQHEQDYFGYYEYPHYWGGEGIWGMGAYPGTLLPGTWDRTLAKRSPRTAADAHLRSARDIQGYGIQGSDAKVGHVDDFLVDDETWQVRYLVVDAGHWWLGKKVLVAPRWATSVSWEESTVHVDLTREQIKSSPEWDPNAPVNREYEVRLYDYYGRPAYWAAESDLEPALAGSHAAGRSR